MEEEIVQKSYTAKDLSRRPLPFVVENISRVRDPSEIAKVIKDHGNALGKNPPLLVKFLQTLHDERVPHTESAISELIEVKNLDANKTRAILPNEQTIDSLRELKNIAVHRSLAATEKGKPGYEDNPIGYEENYNKGKISVDDLVTYLTQKNPESTFHFLRNKKFLEDLKRNPGLIAKMIASNNNNLRQTIKKALKTQLSGLAPTTKQSLAVLIEAFDLLNSAQMKENPDRKALINRAHDLANHADFSDAHAADDFHTQAKTALNNDILSMLETLPNSDAKQLAIEKLTEMQKSQTVPGQGPYPFKLHAEVNSMKIQHDMFKKVQKWLNDPLLQRSARFNALRPELERLDANSPATELGKHESLVEEQLWPKNMTLNTLDRVLGDLQKIDPHAAEELIRFRGDFNDEKEQREIDDFVKGVKKTISKTSLLNQASAILNQLGENHPQYMDFKQEIHEERERLYGELHRMDFKTGDAHIQQLCTKLQKAHVAMLEEAGQTERQQAERAAQASLQGSPKEMAREEKKEPGPATRVQKITITAAQAEKRQEEKQKKGPRAPVPAPPGLHK